MISAGSLFLRMWDPEAWCDEGPDSSETARRRNRTGVPRPATKPSCGRWPTPCAARWTPPSTSTSCSAASTSTSSRSSRARRARRAASSTPTLRRQGAGRDAGAVQGPSLRPLLRLVGHVRAVGRVHPRPRQRQRERRQGARRHQHLRTGVELHDVASREMEIFPCIRQRTLRFYPTCSWWTRREQSRRRVWTIVRRLYCHLERRSLPLEAL